MLQEEFNPNRNQIQLNEGYYLENFFKVLEFVEEKYSDLLSKSEFKFIIDFKQLSLFSQRLYIRLISRKGPHFRLDKLSYSEVGDISETCRELIQSKFFQKNNSEDLEDNLHLLTKPELIQFVKINFELDSGELKKVKSLGKQDLVEFALGFDEETVFQNLFSEYEFVTPLRLEELITLKLLFFGNLEQDLSQFVIEDLGVMKFESYEIREEDRYFKDRQTLKSRLKLIELGIELFLARDENDVDMVLELGRELLKVKTPTERLKRKKWRAYNRHARYLEKFELWDEAIEFYSKSFLAPSRERWARVCEKKDDFEGALKLVKRMEVAPWDQSEVECLAVFGERLKKKMGLPYIKAKRETFETMELKVPRGEENVEFLTLDHLSKQKVWNGFYTENVLLNGLLGLYFWDIIFMGVPGAFYNRFQSGPSDIRSTDFRKFRSEAIELRLDEIKNGLINSKDILDKYENKVGTANVLINWKRLEKEHVKIALKLIPLEHLTAIFDRMISNIGENSKGLPDLFLFNESGYLLGEVKGPGDQLQPGQKRWLRYFEEKGIPYSVLKVSWKN